MLIPRNLVLVDTPGLDAVGLPLHEELTLRRFLPFADIVIYLMPAQLPVKEADLRLLSSIIQNDQRVLFVQSRSDQVKDEAQGGTLLCTRDQKLASFQQRLENDIRTHPGLASFGIVQVASKLAQRAQGNTQSPDWQASNFPAVSAYLSYFSAQIRHFLAMRRGGYILKLLDAAVRDLEALTPDPTVSLEKRAGELKHCTEDLQRAHDRVQALILDAQQPWRPKLVALSNRQRLLQQYSVYDNIYALRSKWHGDILAIDQLSRSIMKDLDEREAQIVRILDAQRIYPKRKQPNVPSAVTQQAPNLEGHVKLQIEKRKTTGWFRSLVSGAGYDESVNEKADIDGFMREAMDFLQNKAAALAKHIDWWENYSSETYFFPLRQELAAEKKALADIDALGRETLHAEAPAHAALLELYALQTHLKGYLEHFERAEGIPLHPPFEAQRLRDTFETITARGR